MFSLLTVTSASVWANTANLNSVAVNVLPHESAGTVIYPVDLFPSKRMYPPVVLVADKGNPWAIPEPPLDVDNNSIEMSYRLRQRGPAYRDQYNQRYHQPSELELPPDYFESYYSSGSRFVTPEKLESLKRQQTQTQLMSGYDNQVNSRSQSPSQLPGQYPDHLPGQEYYGALPGGWGDDPLFDAPMVSPWSSSWIPPGETGNTRPGGWTDYWGGPDFLQRGGSFRYVPDAALGGIPPMNVMPFYEEDSTGSWNGAGPVTPQNQTQNNQQVFNPFTFNRNMHQ